MSENAEYVHKVDAQSIQFIENRTVYCVHTVLLILQQFILLYKIRKLSIIIIQTSSKSTLI